MKLKVTRRKTRKAHIANTKLTQAWAIGMSEPQWIQTGITQDQPKNKK